MGDFSPQKALKYLLSHNKKMYLKAQLVKLSDYLPVSDIEGIIISGNYSINADSDIRRTANLTIDLTKSTVDFTEAVLFNYGIKIYIGWYDYTEKKIQYFNMGIYSFDKNSYEYDATTNQLNLTLSDLCQLMDSEHRGTQYGALKQCIYANDPITGKRYTKPKIVLKNIVENLLKDYGVKNYVVDNIGTYSKNYTPKLDIVPYGELPYDLEFSSNVGFLEILSTIRDLYTHYEFYYDVNGVFWFKKKPVTKDDQIILDENIMNELIISENKDRNVYDVKNVIEVWGKNLTADRYADISNYSNGTYNITLDNYSADGYEDDMTVGIKVFESNSAINTTIQINSLGAKMVYNLETGLPLEQNTLKAGKAYIFKYSAEKNGFYYLGSNEIHAVAIMTNGDTPQDNLKTKYNCDNMSFIVNPESPYCIEKIGEIRKGFNDGDYANISSDDLALDLAEYQLEQLCQRKDTYSIEMLVVPWLDVNQKIRYKSVYSDKVEDYIINSISGDLLSGVMSVTMTKFYPQYK